MSLNLNIARPQPGEKDPPPLPSGNDGESQETFLAQQATLRELLNALPGIVFLLNPAGKIAFGNKALLTRLGIARSKTIAGTTPGEVLRCVHAQASCGGCGSLDACRTCGLCKIMEDGRQWHWAEDQAELHFAGEEPGRYFVHAARLRLGERDFLFVALEGLEAAPWAGTLKRLLFDDVLKAVGGLNGFLQLLGRNESQELRPLLRRLSDLTQEMLTELRNEEIAARVEGGNYKPRPEPLESGPMLRAVAAQFNEEGEIPHLAVRIDPRAETIFFLSDGNLLGKSLSNLVHRARQGLGPRDAVTLGCERFEEHIVFSVHSPAYVPRDVQYQVFRFGTAPPVGPRGTTSTPFIKQVVESCLQGEMQWSADRDAGTTYFLRLPLVLSQGRVGAGR